MLHGFDLLPAGRNSQFEEVRMKTRWWLEEKSGEAWLIKTHVFFYKLLGLVVLLVNRCTRQTTWIWKLPEQQPNHSLKDVMNKGADYDALLNSCFFSILSLLLNFFDIIFFVFLFILTFFTQHERAVEPCIYARAKIKDKLHRIPIREGAHEGRRHNHIRSHQILDFHDFWRLRKHSFSFFYDHQKLVINTIIQITQKICYRFTRFQIGGFNKLFANRSNRKLPHTV